MRGVGRPPTSEDPARFGTGVLPDVAELRSPPVPLRALAVDLDGTLLGPDGRVSERNRRALRAAREAGWHVVLATARWFQLAERTARRLELTTGPVVACSGA